MAIRTLPLGEKTRLMAYYKWESAKAVYCTKLVFIFAEMLRIRGKIDDYLCQREIEKMPLRWVAVI